MKIFISYRRADSQHLAGRLAERLKDAPGVRRIFIDVDGIDPGRNFETAIEEALRESDVCLILIGSDWIGKQEGGTARIQDEEDFVRRETAAALASGKRVIPVLIDGAAMPAKEDLPPDVQSVVTANAVALRHSSFSQDFTVVEDAAFNRKPGTPMARFFRRRPFLTLFLKSAAGVAVAGVLLLVVALVHWVATGGRGLDQTFGGQGVVVLFIIGTLALGGVTPVVRALLRR